MTVLLFIVVLIVLILVHEIGHFVVAKAFGIRVDEFGLGFPPKLFGKKFGETEYTFNAIPAGGFVKIYGEDPDDENTDGSLSNERSFARKPKWVQVAVLASGVGCNVLLAWLLFSGAAMAGIPTAIDESEAAVAQEVKLLITEVLPESPAARAGLAGGVELLALESADEQLGGPLTPSMVADFIATRAGEDVTLVARTQESEQAEFLMVPQAGVIAEDPDRAAAGFSMTLAGEISYPPHEALWHGAKLTGTMLANIVVGLGGFFMDIFSFNADFSAVAGPVGIAGMVGDAATLGFVWVVTFAAFISLNLAVINLLPFPALDGGRILFVIIEALKGSPIRPSVAAAINRIGFALLILLMIAVTYNDVVKIL